MPSEIEKNKDSTGLLRAEFTNEGIFGPQVSADSERAQKTSLDLFHSPEVLDEKKCLIALGCNVRTSFHEGPNGNYQELMFEKSDGGLLNLPVRFGIRAYMWPHSEDKIQLTVVSDVLGDDSEKPVGNIIEGFNSLRRGLLHLPLGEQYTTAILEIRGRRNEGENPFNRPLIVNQKLLMA